MKRVLPLEGWVLLIKTLIRVSSSPPVPAVEWIPQSARSPAVSEEVNWASHKSPSSLTLQPPCCHSLFLFLFLFPISHSCPHLPLPLHRPSFHSNRLPWKLGDSAIHPIPARALREVFREGKVCFCFLQFTGIHMKLWLLWEPSRRELMKTWMFAYIDACSHARIVNGLWQYFWFINVFVSLPEPKSRKA